EKAEKIGIKIEKQGFNRCLNQVQGLVLHFVKSYSICRLFYDYFILNKLYYVCIWSVVFCFENSPLAKKMAESRRVIDKFKV
ncbi:MAG TPA: hypothetical protein H9675_07805, partial [Firmicutes bacterium]|nr:hypothetical protein [Bacillota bacterium]